MRNSLWMAMVPVCAFALPAFTQPTWTRTSPGGGGAFLTADVAADGTVLIGSDLSGAYRRAGAGNWTRLGARDGLQATSVEVVRWKPRQSLIALAGTRNGLFRTPSGDPAVPWTKVTEFGNEDVTALAWKGDTAYATTGGHASSTLKLRMSTDGGGRSWVTVTHDLPVGLRAVKLAVDPFNARILWLLSGNDRLFKGRKELWKSVNFGASWALMSVQNAGHLHAIDFALRPSSPGVVLMTTSTTGPAGGDDDRGSVYTSSNGGGTWSAVTTLPAGATGAVWYDGPRAYLVNVQADACGRSPPARSGRFESADDGATWTKVDDGVAPHAWDIAWTNCPLARGRALSTVARTLSAKGEYWVTTQFVWRYTTTAPFKYENACATRVGSGPASWITKGIDNAVPTAFASTGTGAGHYLAGYYDLGIWSSVDDGASWVNKNPVLGDWKGLGGNVTGIVTAGNSVTVATMAPSSKVVADSGNAYLYSVWRSNDGGDSWSISRAGLPYTGFLHGLSRDPGTARLWLTRNGRVYSSTNTGLGWSPAPGNAPSSGIYVTQARDGVVLVGGTHGLFRSTAPGYETWSPVEHGAFDFSDDLGEVVDPSNPGISTLHKRRWHGIQQILFDPLVANRVWVVSYYGNKTPGRGRRIGIWKSDDKGVTFSPVTKATLRRGVAIDSLGCRLHITSGSATTAGSNDSGELGAAEGKETWRDDGSGTFPLRSIDTDHPDYRYRFGGPITIAEDGKIFVGVPGYGFMRQDMSPAPAAAGARRLGR